MEEQLRTSEEKKMVAGRLERKTKTSNKADLWMSFLMCFPSNVTCCTIQSSLKHRIVHLWWGERTSREALSFWSDNGKGNHKHLR